MALHKVDDEKDEKRERFRLLNDRCLATLFATPLASRPHLIVMAFLAVTLLQIERVAEGAWNAATVDAANMAHTHVATTEVLTIFTYSS